MAVSISIYHDTRRVKQNDKYPVKLRVCDHVAPAVFYPTIFDLTKDEYKKFSAPRINGELGAIRKKLRDLLVSAQQCAEQLDQFSFYVFERDFVVENPSLKVNKIKTPPPASNVDFFDSTQYLEKFPILKEDTSNPLSLSALYVSYIKKLLIADRIGSADNYQDSYKSLKSCWGNITLMHITTDALNYYEKWMLNRKRSLTTVGIKLRHLRTIFNVAIEMDLVSKKLYPFGQHRYVIPIGRNIKKALTIDDVRKIYNYNTESDEEAYGRDMWLFLYQGNGMNPKDMVSLKFKNIDDDFLHFQRAKTKNTTRHKPKTITVYITDDMKAIIDKWGNRERAPNNYIFPILRPEQSPMQQHYAVRNFVRRMSRLIKPIGQALGISINITPTVARHSHATHLKRAGASTEFIQENLGHHDIATTEFYLDSFEKELKKEIAQKLFSFQKCNNW